MSAAFVRECETWPAAASPFTLEVLSDDGEHASMFTPGTSEVTLIEKTDDGAFVVPIAFDTYEQAERAGRMLADTFAAVREIQAEPAPTPCRIHDYRVSLFARDFKHIAVCRRCNTVADVVVREAA